MTLTILMHSPGGRHAEQLHSVAPCRVAPWGPVEKRSGTVWMDGGGFIVLFEQD